MCVVAAVAEGCSGSSATRSRVRGDGSGGDSGEPSSGSSGSAGTGRGGSAVGGRATGGDGGMAPDAGAGEGSDAGEAGAAGAGASGDGGGGVGGAGGAGTAGMSGAAVAGMGGAGARGAGGAGAAGMAGTGGRPSAVECRTNEDCYLLDDCCGNCSAEPIPRAGMPPRCRLVCDATACVIPGIRTDDVICHGGQCVLNRSCDASRRTCDSLPPVCPEGQLPSIDDSGCWGPCLAPTECREVTSCADCASDLCVEFEGPRILATCRALNVSCEKESYCQCLEPCGGGAAACSELDDRLRCTCILCG